MPELCFLTTKTINKYRWYLEKKIIQDSGGGHHGCGALTKFITLLKGVSRLYVYLSSLLPKKGILEKYWPIRSKNR